MLELDKMKRVGAFYPHERWVEYNKHKIDSDTPGMPDKHSFVIGYLEDPVGWEFCGFSDPNMMSSALNDMRHKLWIARQKVIHDGLASLKHFDILTAPFDADGVDDYVASVEIHVGDLPAKGEDAISMITVEGRYSGQRMVMPRPVIARHVATGTLEHAVTDLIMNVAIVEREQCIAELANDIPEAAEPRQPGMSAEEFLHPERFTRPAKAAEQAFCEETAAVAAAVAADDEAADDWSASPDYPEDVQDVDYVNPVIKEMFIVSIGDPEVSSILIDMKVSQEFMKEYIRRSERRPSVSAVSQLQSLLEARGLTPDPEKFPGGKVPHAWAAFLARICYSDAVKDSWKTWRNKLIADFAIHDAQVDENLTTMATDASGRLVD